MKKILVPCDFSAQAMAALRFAIDLADDSGGVVYLLHVVEVPVMHSSVFMPTLGYGGEIVEDLIKNANKQFQRIQMKYGGQGRKIKSDIVIGITTSAILEHVESVGADVVVMGTTGATGAKELLVGSNAERIVRGSSIPVLTVKRYIRPSSIKNIVFPNTLLQDQEDLTLKVKGLQNLFKAKLHIVYINTPVNFLRDVVTLRRLKDFAKRFMLKDFTVNVYNDIYEEAGINGFASSIPNSLIAIGTHGRTGIPHLLSGSVAEDVVNHVDRPVWTYAIKT